MEVKNNYSLKEHNSFGINAKAADFISINSTEEIQELVHFLKKYSKKYFIIGSGSNLLFTKDFDGCIITFKNETIEIIKEDDNHIWIRAAAGIEWDDFVSYCVKKSWSGIENLSLIPGKVGSSAVQNIGAYGVEAKDSIDKVEAFNLNTAEKIIFSNKDCNFDYRYSTFKEQAKDNYLITSVSFKLNKNFKANLTYSALENYLTGKSTDISNCEDIRNAIIDIRQSKLPDHKEIGNAGSFFKNPIVSVEKKEELVEKYPDIVTYRINAKQYKLAAGWLIDKAGWKGKSIGNVGVHHQQALVIVNHGKASGKEIYDFSEKIKKDVLDTFSVTLNREVIVL